MVTAAVCREGFDQKLRLCGLTSSPTFRYRAGRFHTVYCPLSCLHSYCVLINSCSQLVSAAGFQPVGKPLHLMPACFSPRLRHHFAGSFTRSSLKRLSILYPTTCVGFWGTINGNLELRGFSRKQSINHFTTVVARRHASVLTTDRICGQSTCA